MSLADADHWYGYPGTQIFRGAHGGWVPQYMEKALRNGNGPDGEYKRQSDAVKALERHLVRQWRVLAHLMGFDENAMRTFTNSLRYGLALAAEGVGDIPGSYTEQPHGDK